jgi:hypothetical protein
MGIESVPKSMENFPTLMWLSAQEDFIDFCCCASFKTYIISLEKKDKNHDIRSGKSLEKKVTIVELNGLYAETLHTDKYESKTLYQHDSCIKLQDIYCYMVTL